MNTRLVRDFDGIYDVLVEECGAPEGQDRRMSFDWCFSTCICADLGATGIGQRHTRCPAHDPIEHRFGGLLGFGGKLHWAHGRLYVSCYQEDRTPERAAMIERANARLATFVKEIR